MKYVVIAVLSIALVVLLAAFIAGAVAIVSAEDELTRELDDIDQAEYLRQWQEKRRKKR